MLSAAAAAVLLGAASLPATSAMRVAHTVAIKGFAVRQRRF
jgi:hypothetical protein